MLAVVGSVAIPLLLLTAVIFGQFVATSRQQVREGLMSTARSLAAAVDIDIETPIAIAGTLAATQMLRTGDFDGFTAHAQRALDIMPGAWIALTDAAPRLITTTFGGNVPADTPATYKAVIEAARSSAKPQLSDIIDGPIVERPHAILAYPVALAGEHRFTILVGLPPERFLSLLRDKVGSAAAVAIVDRNANFVARIPNHETLVGKPAAAGWRAALAKSQSGFHDSRTVEGEPSLQAYTATRDGWNVGIAMYTNDLEGPVRRLWWTSGLMAGLVAALGLALGIVAARRLGGSLVQLADAAAEVGKGKIVAAKEHLIAEASAIDTALSRASTELAMREEALRESEARFRFTFQNTAVGVAHMDADGRFREVNQRLCDMLGYSPAELQTSTFQQLTHPDDIGADMANQARLAAGDRDRPHRCAPRRGRLRGLPGLPGGLLRRLGRGGLRHRLPGDPV